MHIAALHVYPLKSARGIDIMSAQVNPRGLVGDRRYMLMDNNQQFLSQRNIPKLAQVSTNFIQGGISISWPDQDWIDIYPPAEPDRTSVTIWRDTVDATTVNASVDAALSAWLERDVSLVFMDNKTTRTTNKDWGLPAPVSFADGYPNYILCNSRS